MMTPTVSDGRQMVAIAVNEIRKFVSSRRFSIYVVIMVLSIILVTVLPYVAGGGYGDNGGDIFSMFIMFASIMAMLAATLFASSAIVSEFEERTALILFTRPLKKGSIFIGKFLACILVEAVVIVVYYILGMLIAWAISGDLVVDWGPSLVMAICYVFASSGIAVLISSVMKKAGTAAVVTFIFLMLIMNIFSVVLSEVDVDAWFMLGTASDSILTSLPEYIDMVNSGLGDLPEGMEGVGDIFGDIMGTQPADTVRDGLVMIVWGLAGTILAWIAFARREF